MLLTGQVTFQEFDNQDSCDFPSVDVIIKQLMIFLKCECHALRGIYTTNSLSLTLFFRTNQSSRRL